MDLYYSRVTPYGFIDPATATDEDKYYAEVVTVPADLDGADVLAQAELLRSIYAESSKMQKEGLDSQSQAETMARLLILGTGGTTNGQA